MNDFLFLIFIFCVSCIFNFVKDKIECYKSESNEIIEDKEEPTEKNVSPEIVENKDSVDNFVYEINIEPLNCENIAKEIYKNIRQDNFQVALYIFKKYRQYIADNSTTYYQYLQEKMNILYILNERNINYLVHFTNIRNIHSIVKRGILTREILEKNKNYYFSNDSNRYDRRLDFISLSIEFPNDKMLIQKQHANKDNKYCIIFLDAKELLLNDVTKHYAYTNIANSKFHIALSQNMLTSPKALAAMFNTTVEDGRRSYHRYSSLKSYYTTDSQAEILYNGNISSSNIKKIIFSNKEDMENFIQNSAVQDICKKYLITVDKKFFSQRA